VLLERGRGLEEEGRCLKGKSHAMNFTTGALKVWVNFVKQLSFRHLLVKFFLEGINNCVMRKI
jgi:hypothetical protein